MYICIYVFIYSKILLRASESPHAFLRLNMIFKLLLLFWTAQAWPRRTFGYFGLRRHGPDALSADKLLFWSAQAWPRSTFGYFAAIAATGSCSCSYRSSCNSCSYSTIAKLLHLASIWLLLLFLRLTLLLLLLLLLLLPGLLGLTGFLALLAKLSYDKLS